MDLKSGTLLVAPTVKNSSCSHPRYTSHNFIVHIGIAETIEALLILVLTLGVIGANALVIFVINNRRYAPYIHQQPRYLLTSLALNDLTIGLLITPFGLLPALFHCWPYGEIFCQIQALLRGALSQQSAVILVCMAVDRYMCALHPRRYYQHSSKKGCVAILSLTWIISLTVFGFLVLPKGYYFNNTGLMACEPFYSKPSYRILSTCALYFPTTMVLMYCYGSSFHMSRFRLNDPTMPLTAAAHHPHPHYPPHSQHAAHQHQHQLQHQHHQHQHQHHLHPHQLQHHQQQQQFQQHSVGGGAGGGGGGAPGSTPMTSLPNTPVINLSMAMSMGLGMAGMGGPKNTITKKIVPIQEKHSSGATSRSMAAISLGFIVMVTPWTIQEIVTACTGSKLPPFLDFLVTWTALSNSFWNPFMYWLLNSDFRRLSRHLMPNRCFPTEDTPEHKSSCCHINSADFEITALPVPPEPPSSRPPNSGGGSNIGVGSGGGSVLGICARSRANSLSRSASQYIRSSAGHHAAHHGGGGGGGGGPHHSHFGGVRPDIEGLSEKYWGEILERTVSSGSLHAMQKSFPHTHHTPHALHHAHHQLQHLQHHSHTQQQQQQAAATSSTAALSPMMTTSFSKHSDLNLTISEHERQQDVASNNGSGSNGGGGIENDLSKFSNSEPKLCEHFYHDANCAKNKSALGVGASAATAALMAGGVGEDTKMASATGRNIPDI